MASNYWLKLYHEILDDPKMGRLRDSLWRRGPARQDVGRFGAGPEGGAMMLTLVALVGVLFVLLGVWLRQRPRLANDAVGAGNPVRKRSYLS